MEVDPLDTVEVKPEDFDEIKDEVNISEIYSTSNNDSCAPVIKANNRKVKLRKLLWLCKICRTPIETVHQLKMHMMEHKNDCPIQCDECGERFKTSLDAQKHAVVHSDLVLGMKTRLTEICSSKNAKKFKLHVCPKCGKQYAFQENLQQHMLEHTEEPPDKEVSTENQNEYPTNNDKEVNANVNKVDTRRIRISSSKDAKASGFHQCPKCSRQYVFLHRLQGHMLFAHGEKLSDEEVSRRIKEKQVIADESMKQLRKCQSCPLSFMGAPLLMEHVRAAHPETLFPCDHCDRSFFTEEDLFDHKRGSASGDSRYPCTMCPNAFALLSELEVHTQLAHPNRSHRCEECGVSFASAVYLRQHSMRHEHRTRFICETCGKVCNANNTLLIHIEEKHAVKKPTYDCKVCGKTFKALGSFKVHMKLHSSEPGDFECGVCRKRFKLQYYYNRHVYRHIKPHDCDLCHMRFRRKYEFIRHKRWHAREVTKPYSCEQCSKRFSTAAAVAFHKSTLHDNKKHLKCDICQREFYNRFHYAAHYGSHTGVRPYKCDTCGKGFNYNTDLMKHKKLCTPQRNEEDEATSTSTS